MEFDEIVVKESPGLCRCCLSEGCYKDMGTEYSWMSENEVYAEMLLECFDISISQHNEGPNGPNRLICEVCITRLRDACYFKKQVLDSEKKFVDMVGRGEFKSKVIVYQTQLKMERPDELDVTIEPGVEYLDDEMDFGDDDLPKPDEPSVSEVTADPLPVRKRGRPRKTTLKPETKKKLKVERKAKTVVKGERKIEPQIQENRLQRLCRVRNNVYTILQYGNVMPFKWHTKGFSCFYCLKPMKDCDSIKEHMHSKHLTVDLNDFITKTIFSKDVPVKIDITDIACRYCPGIIINSFEQLVTHITTIHGGDYDDSDAVSFLPFVLDKNNMQCVLCDSQFDNFTSIMNHMNKQHVSHSHICQICGLSFVNMIRLNRHINSRHVGYKCTVCDQMFDAYNKLESHKSRLHGQSKTHDCNLCSDTFENRYLLKVHMGKAHNVEKYRIRCEYCPKICTTKGAMILHTQSMHSTLKYECDLCNYKTAIKWLIKLHKRKHFGEKNYECSICERKFGRSSNVRVHMKVHTGLIGRVCRWCRKGFTDSDALEKHKTEAHLMDPI